jgi:T-complex protein 1 subunit gamma
VSTFEYLSSNSRCAYRSTNQFYHSHISWQAVSDIIRTTLGPRAMLKMMMDPMGGIVLTMDGNAILRELDVSHPAAKSMIELSRTQDEEVGDGTTSVIVLGTAVSSCACHCHFYFLFS